MPSSGHGHGGRRGTAEPADVRDATVRPSLAPDFPWRGRRVALGVCGGIAAYKAVQIARDLTLLGADVDVALTRAARRFVAPLSFEGVTGRSALQDAFQAGGAALHVGLARGAECVCVAPATADFVARAAAGRADDLLAATIVASDAPLVVAPAMNDRMFAHPRTKANLEVLERSLGARRVGPDAGRLAAGEGGGVGRMAPPSDVVDAVGRALCPRSALCGARVLVTAGPTREPVDAVRYVGARSSGKMGYAIARAAFLRGARATLVSGPASVPPPYGVETVRVETARQMRDAVLDLAPEADVAVHAAAVSDYRPAAPLGDKAKRSSVGDAWTVELVVNPDVAAESGARMREGSVTVGFALETEDLLARAAEKMRAKGFDLVVANPAGRAGVGFEADANEVVLLERGRAPVELPRTSKFRVAGEILDRVAERLRGRDAR